MRRRMWWLVLVLATVGCGPQKETTASGGNTETTTAPLKVGLVTDAGGIDDQSFNAAAWAGVQKAQKELGLPEPQYVESKEQADYKTNLSTLAEQKVGLVFGAGFLMEDQMKEVAQSYPDTKFASIDGQAMTGPDGKPLPNALALRFREEEGCFLAGYLAGKMSKTGAVGFIGGMESPLIKKFEVGYYAGAKTANPKIRMIAKYVGDWTDNAKGKELALAAMDQGADILFAAAGKGGLGALDAVAQKGAGYYGIGVDADQDGLHKGRILTSMMKRVDLAVFETIRSAKEGTWAPGERVLGLKEGMIHLSPMTYTKQDVPPALLKTLDTLKERIITGQIKVPTTEEERQNFVAPKV